MSLLKVLANVSSLLHQLSTSSGQLNISSTYYITFSFIDLQQIDTIIDKQCQHRNERLSEMLSTLVREEMQTELNRVLTTMQDNTIRAVRDSIRENLSQQLTEISSVR